MKNPIPTETAEISERVMASIRLKEEFQGKVSPADIQEFCKKHLSPYEVPAYVEFRQELPLTVTEKVFKKVLREEAIQKMKAGRGAA